MFALGLDTGGTFTDAALLKMSEDGEAEVFCKTKSLTTRDDLSVGLADATKRILRLSKLKAEDVGLVSLSTTLATNAIVEGHGAPVALVTIGFGESDIKQAGLEEALGGDPHIRIDGGHTPHGEEVSPPNLEQLKKEVAKIDIDTVRGFALAGFFGVRNPSHELSSKELLVEMTGLPVTCSHELSAQLNGPKRALTCLLNARLVPLISRLIDSTQAMLEKMNVHAPLMVVRGDGALVSAEFACNRPVETILSGPAASLIGARHLTKLDNAWVCDIGGTTSDIACLEGGKPRLDEQGAKVGEWRTMVEAVAMRTFGLGGDSQLKIEGTPGSSANIVVGPARTVPVSLVARDYPIVHETLNRQVKTKLANRYDGRFVFKRGDHSAVLSGAVGALLEEIGDEPVALDTLMESHRPSALARLVNQGAVMVAGPTPTDALHCLGVFSPWDTKAAGQAIGLLARQYSGTQKTDAKKFATEIVECVRRRSAEAILQTALDEDKRDASVNDIIRDVLGRSEESKSHVEFAVSLTNPLVGLGAAAEHYHPDAAKILKTEVVIPEHAEVANAIGAVVGQIRVSAEVTITQPTEGKFSVTGNNKPFGSEAKAMQTAEKMVRKQAAKLAKQAGSPDDQTQISVEVDQKRATIESRDLFVEAKVTATATGRPRFAREG